MASEFYQRDDLTIYVVAGVPKSFKNTLSKLVEETSNGSGDVKMANGEMTEWIQAKLREDGRRSYERTPASSALWRAYRALSAACYHIQDEGMEEQIREIREQVEDLWTRTSPLMKEEEEEAKAATG